MAAEASAPGERPAHGVASGRVVSVLAWAVLLAVLAVPLWRGADAPFPWDLGLAPGGVLRALGARFGHGWNPATGPLPFYIDALVAGPLLLFMRLTHELGHPVASYPWGFVHPERALAAIVVATRLVSLLMAVGVVALAVRDARRSPAQPAQGLVPLLFAGSACFAFYAKASTADMSVLFWLWLAYHPAGPAARTRLGTLGRGLCAAAAAACTPQALPMATVALGAACVRAYGERRMRRDFVAVAAVAVFAYVLLWQIPWNPELWRAQHVGVSWFGSAPRQFPPGLAGAMALLWSDVGRSFVVFGLPILFGMMLFVAAHSSGSGLGARAVGCALHLATIATLGFARTLFLMPLMVLAVPLAARGIAETWRLSAREPRARASLARAVAVFALLGGPLLTWMLLIDPRFEAERWLSTHAARGESVEVAGNPQFQARIPAALRMVRTSPDSLRASPRGPRGDYVLLSSDDSEAFKRDSVIRAAWWDSLDHPLREGPYAEHLHYDSPYAIRVLEGIPIPPDIDLYVRASPRH